MNVPSRLYCFVRVALGILLRGRSLIAATLLALMGLQAARAVTLTPGDVLVADAGTSASTSGIVQVNPTNGNRTFITGNGVGSGAAIDTPKFPIVSLAGTVYYVETVGTNAKKVVSVDPATGGRAVVSGTGTGTGTNFASITGLCWDPSTSTLLVADAGSSASTSGIIRVDPTTGNRTFVTGNGAGSGVAIDTLNFVACSTSGTIYYYETVASGTANFIISVNGATGARAKASGSGTGTGLNWVAVTGMRWDANTSQLMVSDAGASASTSGLVRVDPATGNRVFLTGNSAGSGVALDTPTHAVVASAGTAYYFEMAAAGTAGFVISADGTSGARAKTSGTGTGTGTNFASITGLAVVTVTSPPVINSALVASGTYGTATSTYTIAATNAPTSYNATNLPPGLSINTTNGEITGTPSTPVGSPFSVTISATNSGGTGTATLVYTINKAVLTISGLTANSKVYDGTTVATINFVAPALNGQVGADDVQANAGAISPNFANRNVGTGKTVTVTGFSLSGAQANRYTLTDPTMTADITAKALTVTGVTGTARTYDGSTTASLSGTAAFQTAETAGTGAASDGKPYTVDTIAIGGAASATFADRHVGTAKPITVTGLTITGTNASNYTITQPAGLTANVTPKPLTVSGLSAVATRVYDGTSAAGVSGTAAFQTAETVGSGTTADGKPYTVDTIAISGTAAGAFADRHVGAAKPITVTGVTVTGTDSANYSVTQQTGLTGSITAKALTTSGLAAVATRVYDGTTVADLTGTATFRTAETAGAGTTVDGRPYTIDTISIGGTATGAFANRNVGTGKAITVSGITVTGTDSGNYTVTQPTGLAADVTTKALSVSGLTAVATRVYDGTAVASLTGTAAFQTAETAGTGTTLDGVPYSVDTITVGGTAAGAFPDRNVGAGKAITVSGVTVTGIDSGNYTVTQPTGLTGSVTAKALSVSGLSAVASRTYDGTTVADLTGTAAFLSGEAAGAGTTVDGKPYTVDTISIGGAAAGSFADRNVGTAKAITVTGVTVTGTDSANYTVNQATGLTANITAKALTVAGVTASDKIYDATVAAPLGGTAAFLSSEAAGTGTTVDGKPYSVDTITIGGTAAGAFTDKDVATGKAVTVTGIAVTGIDSGNYSVTQPTGLTAAITVKNLSISGVNAANKVYDGTTSVSLSGSPTLQAAEAPGTGTTSDGKPYTGDTFSAGGIINGAFADRNVGTGKTITVTGVGLSGAQAGNYVIGSITTTADITPKALTISGVSAVATRVYDGTTVAGLTGTPAFASAETAGTGATSDGIPYAVDSVTVGGTATGAFADRNVGTGKAITVTGLTVTGTGSDNYTATQPTGLTADITAKALTVAGLSAVPTRVYDSTAAAGLTGTAAFLTAEATGAGTTADGTPYTVDTIAIGGTAAGAFATKAVGTAKAITVTGVTVTGTDSANYSVTQPTGLTANVTAAGLTISGVTANNKIYDGNATATLNTGSAALVGVIGGDVVTLNSGSATGTFNNKTIGTGKAVTTAGFALTGTDAGNYSLTQPSTTASVTAKTITVGGITVANKIYDGTTTGTPTYTGAAFTGVVSGDTVTLVSSGGTATFNNKTVATGKPVTFAGLALAGADSANYALAQPTATADITAKNLTVAGITANNKTYNGTTSATLVTTSAALVGVVSGDVVTLNTGGAAGTFSDANAGGGKIVTVTGLTITGTDSANYSLTQPTTTASISQATASITITNTEQTYDALPKPVTVTVSPSLAATVLYSGSLTVPTNAGTYTVGVSVSNNNFTGSGSAILTIAKAPQTVNLTIAGGSFAVGTSHALTATSTSGGPITYAVTSGTATLSGSSVTVTQPGAVTIRATQAGTDNYLPATADQGFTGVSAVKQSQTITFAALSNRPSNAAPFTLDALASSGLSVTYSVVSGPATISGSSGLVLTGTVGLVTIRASQAGNDTYLAAQDVIRSFLVTPALPDIFFGDLSDDPGIAGGADGRGELISSGGPRLDAKRGDIAAVLYVGTNRGTVAIVAPTLNLNVAIDFVLAANNTYSVAFTSAGRSLTLTGSVANGTLTGRIAALNVSFSTPAQARTGSMSDIAGAYESDAVNSATGGTTTIISPTGQILVVANTGTVSAGAVGTIGTSGTFSLAGTGVTIAGSVDGPTTSVTGTITVAGQSAIGFTSLSALAAHTDRLINLSSRVRIAPTRTLITGFVIGGADPKKVLIRGVGPALTGFGVNGALVNPKLSLFDAAGKTLLENDDWSGTDTSAAFSQVGAFSLPTGSKDAALLTTLAPGAYTVQITAGAETGVALAEIYDASTSAGTEPQRLVNISTRGTVDLGSDGLLIGGFVVTGNVPKRVLIRGVGPSLAGFGVTGTLVDPRLTVYNGSTLIAQNDDWSTPTPLNAQQTVASASEITAAGQSVGAFNLGAGTKDSALVIILAPGAYTAQIAGANGATGVALVEIYELP